MVHKYEPYEFKPIIDIYGVEIKIFENIFSVLIQNILIDELILQWLKNIAKNPSLVRYNPHIYQLRLRQPAIMWFDPDMDAKMKIHICVKPEFLFWTFHKLLLMINQDIH